MEFDMLALFDLVGLVLAAFVVVTLILTVAGVILLKPLSQRLGFLLEAMAREKNELRSGAEMARLRDLLEGVETRMSLLEERRDFEEAIREGPRRRGQLPQGSSDSAQEGP
jgi:hypothetical protein